MDKITDKMDRWRMILFYSFLIIVCLFITKSGKERRDYLIDKGIMSVGQIVRGEHSNYQGYNRLLKSVKASYVFELDGEIYKNAHGAGIPKDVYLGNKYLLFVDKDNYKNSLILFDKPVKDSLDFERYVKEFGRENAKQE